VLLCRYAEVLADRFTQPSRCVTQTTLNSFPSRPDDFGDLFERQPSLLVQQERLTLLGRQGIERGHESGAKRAFLVVLIGSS